MSEALQEKIVSLLPSKSLKNEIRNSGFRLSDMDLLAAAFRYAPDYKTRLELLGLLESHFTGELGAYTGRLIEVQRKTLDEFVKSSADAVFELHIKKTPDAYDERYMCSSYEAAVKMISLFYREYDCRENGSSRYEIVKRRVFSGGKDEAFSEDELGSLTLLPGAVFGSVKLYSHDHAAEECDGECSDCVRFCVSCHETPFPPFVAHGDAVKYYEASGKESFGFALCWDGAPSGECYVIPLESNPVRYHDFENMRDDHQHIPAPLVERIAAEELPPKLREDRAACLAYLKETHSVFIYDRDA